MPRPLLAAIAALCLVGPATSALAQTPTPAAATDTTLTVHLRGMSPGKGAAIVLLFDSEANYDASKSVQSSKLDATAGAGDVSFAGLTPGRYAIRAFYDSNGNGAYDAGSDGIGFSNHVTMSDATHPPTFSETSFMVRAGANTQQITFSVVR